MFDPEKFGEAMGAAIREAVSPLLKRIGELEAQVSKPVDVSADVERAVAAAVAALPPPKDGKDAAPIDKEAIVKEVLALVPVPSNGIEGAKGQDGKNGADGLQGQKGADGLGLAGAMIDRDGALQITLTNGEVKSLGPVVGKNGTDGKDGLSLDAFELEYLPESHEVSLKATAAGRTKELRYPAGGIRPAGYWREGTKAQAGEAWVHDGSLWIAIKGTPTKPATGLDDWIIAARKGRDGERGTKGIDGSPPAPIKLKV
jgi:hypothetical protein